MSSFNLAKRVCFKHVVFVQERKCAQMNHSSISNHEELPPNFGCQEVGFTPMLSEQMMGPKYLGSPWRVKLWILLEDDAMSFDPYPHDQHDIAFTTAFGGCEMTNEHCFKLFEKGD